ncbi:putative phage abortive infection protein [Fulvivirga ligni]|uniref:putative phage abortive infection protein n=1 Tax=Fulvivirga ligni TaxID=2904246 RepID=UPI001F420466|nr:putative phage abortive infection protein [Fulvivirga ligni]UII22699.1 putative phage abortive infection protein [Fulvivirga ligni]
MRRLLQNEKLSIFLIFLGLIIIVLGIISFLWLNFNLRFDKSINSELFARFGDFIGGVVGSIWALAGVMLFYIALSEQRNDFRTNREALDLQINALNQQIKEFQLQRAELTSSRKIYEDQSNTLRVQQFESNFYSLLNVYLTIKKNLNEIDKDGDFFKSLQERLLENYDISNLSVYELHNGLIKKYMQLYQFQRGHLSHYFKAFYRLVKIIESNKVLSDNEKIFYAKILRSQLTDYEQLILYYNSHSIYGTKARSLILQYNLLKHVPMFHKPEFHQFKKEDYHDLLQFSDRLTYFLIKHINSSYDVDNEVLKVEEEFVVFKCIVGIYFEEAIDLKVFCKKDIRDNNIQLGEDDFHEFLFYFLHDRLVFSTYLDITKVRISKFKTEEDELKIFGLRIESDSQLILNHDKIS